MTQQLSGVTTDPYETGWRAWLQLPVNRLAGAAMKLSHAGRQAVTVGQIAAEGQVPLPEATTLTFATDPSCTTSGWAERSRGRA